MPPLENLKHETFARTYPEVLNATKAYQLSYPDSKQESAEANGPRLIGNDRVKNRIVEIMEQKAGLTDDYISGKIREHVDHDDGNLSHKAVRTILELKGYLNKDQQGSIASVIFNEVVVGDRPSAIDAQSSDNRGAEAPGTKAQVVDTQGVKDD